MPTKQQAIYYAGRVFVAAADSTSGEVSASTRFYYHQEGDAVWAESGGDILKGFLPGRVPEDGRLTFHYQHMNKSKVLRIGPCVFRPERLDDGRLRLFETWRLGGKAGTSALDGLPDRGTSWENTA